MPAKKAAPASTTSTRKTARKMTNAHKQAMVEGRNQGRAVRAYLDALAEGSSRRGRSPEAIQARIDKVTQQMETANSLRKVELIQQQMNLTAQLQSAAATVDLDALEKDFVANVGAYAERKKISYAAWRKMKVPARVLAAAGISRSYNP